MDVPKSVWMDALDWMRAADAHLPAVFPPELPPETAVDFWFHVSRLEMPTRERLSAKIRLLVNGAAIPAMPPLEAWLFRRRVEWGAQMVLAKVREGIEPDADLQVVLTWLLIDSWESDGCIALWNQAERGGKPHPGNPDAHLFL